MCIKGIMKLVLMVFGEILSATPSAMDTYSFKGGLEARFLVSLCKKSAFLAPTC